MKFLVAVDLEGIACAYGVVGGSIEDSFNIAFVRKQASLEADAAARALFDCGAEEVVVWDCHGRGCSLDYMAIDRRVKLAIGAGGDARFPVIDGFTGVLFIGYHAMAGTPKAAMAHTFNSKKFQGVWVNEEPVGEIAIDAMIAGEHGVPVIFVSSDDKGVAEAQATLPWAETVVTKESLAMTRVISKHPAAVVDEIYEAVKKAVGRLLAMQLYHVQLPLELKLRYCRADECQASKIYDNQGQAFSLTDAFTRQGSLNHCEDIIPRL